MITIKCREDIQRARLPTLIELYVDRIFVGILSATPDFDPEEDGKVVVVTPRDTDTELCKIMGLRWSENMFEGVSYNKEHRCYHAVILANNQYTTSIIIPTDHNVDPHIIARIQQEIAYAE